MEFFDDGVDINRSEERVYHFSFTRDIDTTGGEGVDSSHEIIKRFDAQRGQQRDTRIGPLPTIKSEERIRQRRSFVEFLFL